jgi:hypothetical protein
MRPESRIFLLDTQEKSLRSRILPELGKTCRVAIMMATSRIADWSCAMSEKKEKNEPKIGRITAS